MGVAIVAAWVVAMTTAFIVLMDLVPTPLNRNIAHSTTRERLPSTLIHGTVGIAFAVCAFLGFTWVLLASGVWYTIVLAVAVVNWWIPYLFGVSRGEITPDRYATEYRDNVAVLRPFRGHPIVPDVQHSVIHLGVLASATLSYVAFPVLLGEG